MFEAISRLFSTPKPAGEPMDTRLAVAALLVHLSSVDGVATPREHQTIANVLRQHFGLGEAQVKKLLEEARRRDREAVDFYQFTAALAKLDEEERIGIIRLMWQVVFADSRNHELEDNMVWRVAELIGVSARQRTILRARIRRAASDGEDGGNSD